MKLAILCAALTLVGCATMEQQAQRLSTAQACYFEAAGNPNQQHVASQELRNRGAACNPQLVQIGAQEVAQARQQKALQDAQTLELGARLLATPPPAVAPSVNCYTSYGSRDAYTTCR